jgi:hypothetical protein
MSHMYLDNFWLRLAHELDRCRFLPDVLVEHMHPAAGKGEPDDVYRENDTHYAADEAAYARFVDDPWGLDAAVERCRAVL